MTKPISRSEVSAVQHPDSEPSSGSAPHPQPQHADGNHVMSWSGAAPLALGHIEHDYGYGVIPDMDSVKKELSSLNGFDLLYVMEHLEEAGSLEGVLGEMTSSERQALINQAIAGNLLERESPPVGRLKAKGQPLPESFQKMIDELNLLGSEESTGPHRYNWSAASERLDEKLDRSARSQVSGLKIGDSVEVSALLGGGIGFVKADEVARLGIERTERGYVVSGDLGASLRVKAGHAIEAEASAGVFSRAEYTFPNAEAAYAAAKLLMSNPKLAVETLKPSALEVRGELAAELSAKLNVSGLQLAELSGEASGSSALRLELDGKEPAIVFRATGKLELKDAAMLGIAGVAELEAHGDARLEGKVVVESRFPIGDRKGFMAAPADYVSQHATEMTHASRVKVTGSREAAALHHANVSEVSFTTSSAEGAKFIANAQSKSWREALLGLSTSVAVEVTEKDFKLRHAGGKAEADVQEGSIKVGLSFEKRQVERERVVCQGTAYDLAMGRQTATSSRRRSPGAP